MKKYPAAYFGRRLMKKSVLCVLLALGILICLPVAAVALGSLKSGNELRDSLAAVAGASGGRVSWRLLPLYPTARHFVKLLGQMLVSIPAAWAFAKFSFRGRGALYLTYVILMLMPFSVMMLPSYLVLNGMNLMDTHLAVILPAVFSTFPVFLMYRSFCMIPKEMYEAARIDGAGEWQVFVRIGIPLGSPGILSALVLGFLEYWNMVEQPLAFLATPSGWPLSLYLPEIDLKRAGMALAASVVTLIPAVFVFFMGQDYLEQGIAASGMKE